jgi:hypothetical protein
MAPTQHVISLGLSRRLADFLVEEKLLSAENLKEALDAQKKGGEKLGSLLIEKGFIEEEAPSSSSPKRPASPTFPLPTSAKSPKRRSRRFRSPSRGRRC